MKSLSSIIHPQTTLRKLWRSSDLTHHNNRTILVGLMMPMLMMVLNLSMFAIALPTIRTAFEVQADVAAWIATAYTLPFVVFMPLYGRLGDGLGKRRLFLIGIAIFLVGTIIALLATKLWLLILGRVFQGIGSSGLNPLSIAIISDTFPTGERGKAMSTWNAIGPLGGIVGPFLAGFLIDYWGWRIIFSPVLLAGIVAVFFAQRQLPAMQRPIQPGFLRTFDWGGVILLGAATIMLVFYVSSRPITGFAALQDWRLLGLTLLLFGTFIIWEKRQATPFVRLEIFTNQSFSRASLCAGLRMFMMSGGIGFLIPLYLTDIHGLGATSVGFMIMLHAGALLLTVRVGGQLADRGNSRWSVMIGSAIQVGIMIYFALLPATVSLKWVIMGLLGHGLSAGLSLAALHHISMNRIPPEQTGRAAGLYSMIRFSGTILGIALAGVVLQQGLDRSLLTIEAYQTVFWFIAGVASLGVVISWGLRE